MARPGRPRNPSSPRKVRPSGWRERNTEAARKHRRMFPLKNAWSQVNKRRKKAGLDLIPYEVYYEMRRANNFEPLSWARGTYVSAEPSEIRRAEILRSLGRYRKARALTLIQEGKSVAQASKSCNLPVEDVEAILSTYNRLKGVSE